MLTMLLILCATLSEEVAQSMAKQSIRRRRETVYGLGFLELFWAFIVMLAILVFSHEYQFAMASLPTLLSRIGVEIVAAVLMMEAIAVADRSTIGFLRLIGIPALLLVDIVLGYHITPLQITGVTIMFLALMITFHQNPSGKRGAWLVVLSAVFNVAAISLYKYDITHFNSIPLEQSIVLGSILLFFYLGASRSGRSPFRLLIRPVTGTQSLMSGISGVLGSYAMGMVPASVVVALRRTFALFWAMIFGQTYFHERSMRRKLYSFGLTTAGVALLVSPYLPHW